MKSTTLLLPALLVGASFSQVASATPTQTSFFNKETRIANIIRTEYGIAHVTAFDMGSLSFGSGYAQAQDHACILADSYLRVRGERAKYLGPDQHQAGDNRHVMSDYLYKIAGVHRNAAAAFDTLSADTKAAAQGFAEGYNYYLEKVQKGQATLEPTCAGQDWVQPITAIDVLANIAALGSANGLGRYATAILQAHPEDGLAWLPKAKAAAPAPIQLSQPLPVDKPAEFQTQGSNGWGLGRDKTTDGQGILMANPHFPMTGQMRFWTYHATIPGQMDVMGASILGFPAGVNIGFNKDIAWTHTFSAASQSVIYQLALDPTSKISYLIDGVSKPMEQLDIEVEVKTPIGVQTLTKPVYRAEDGIVIEMQGALDWNDRNAYILKNTNLFNFDSIDHWLAINKASNLAEFQQTFKDHDGLMFNNAVYSDKSGETFFIDGSSVPDLPRAALTYLTQDPTAQANFERFRVPVLPGHSAQFYYTQNVSYDARPKLARQDYVQNANDSYWLANASAPLATVSPLFGFTQTLQSRRTRFSLDRVINGAGTDGKFEASEVESIFLSNRALIEPTIQSVVAACQQGWQVKNVTLQGQSIPLSPVCNALERWDGQFNQNSMAAHLVREFATLISDSTDFLVPFDVTDPANTPRDIRVDEALFEKLATAGEIIRYAGFALDAPLGDMQFFEQHGVRIPWQGNMNMEGGLNVFATRNRLDLTTFAPEITPSVMTPYNDRPLFSGLSTRGYELHFGSSWIMLVDFNGNKVDARGLLTHSQSHHPASPHAHDQGEHYSQFNELIDLPFTTLDIWRNLKSSTLIIK